MRLKYLSITVPILFAALLTGCATLISASTSQPNASFTITLNSIPSGAKVYTIFSGHTLGKMIGITPYKWHVGISVAEFQGGIWGKTVQMDLDEPAHLFDSGGISWGRSETLPTGMFVTTTHIVARTIYLNVALVKKSYATAWVHGQVGAVSQQLGLQFPPKDVVITERLRRSFLGGL